MRTTLFTIDASERLAVDFREHGRILSRTLNKRFLSPSLFLFLFLSLARSFPPPFLPLPNSVLSSLLSFTHVRFFLCLSFLLARTLVRSFFCRLSVSNLESGHGGHSGLRDSVRTSALSRLSWRSSGGSLYRLLLFCLSFSFPLLSSSLSLFPGYRARRRTVSPSRLLPSTFSSRPSSSSGSASEDVDEEVEMMLLTPRAHARSVRPLRCARHACSTVAR